MRTPTPFAPQTLVTAEVTSRSSLARLRGLPPYASSRWSAPSRRNWSSRYPLAACTSTPSKQPVDRDSCHRAVRDVATAQVAVTADQSARRKQQQSSSLSVAEPSSRNAAAISAHNEVTNRPDGGWRIRCHWDSAGLHGT